MKLVCDADVSNITMTYISKYLMKSFLEGKLAQDLILVVAPMSTFQLYYEVLQVSNIGYGSNE